ncbi:FUSC family protein [Azospirillum soli]|uniref:FUSC family protein n=1 Tax=Azospirillum soli TaxID=1304799 RepID=UPI001AE79CA5|nr:FUSC family protein [Azospirillum soli]MBP2312779.1 putative membrane protein YccC [Azospirillum soli]
MSAAAVLTRMGFDRARLPACLRTAVTSWLALVVATLLHIDSPHWAAMTVWVVAQPTRSLLLEKSLYRVAGTVIGSVAAVALIQLTGGSPAPLVVGLALWLGLCAMVGNVLRHFRAYGALMAGATAAMVALTDLPHPDHVFAVAFARVACICVGIAVSALVIGLLTPPAPESDVMHRLRRVSGDTVRWVALTLSAPPGDRLLRERALLSEMAAIEELLDLEKSGPGDRHQRARRVRGLLAALLAFMSAARTLSARLSRAGTPDAGTARWASLVDHLERAASALESTTPAGIPMDALRAAANDSASDAILHAALVELIAALEAVVADRQALDMDGAMWRPASELLFHRDWIGARAAGLRSAVAVLGVGALWIATGWSFGPFMLMGTCIMATLFSTFDNPVMILRLVLMGAAAGAVAATLCRLFLLPMAADETWVLFLVAPFMLAGGIALSNRITVMPALDYNMCFLLLVQPTFPVHATPAAALNAGASVLLGIGAALLAYRFVMPVDSSRRLQALVTMIIHDLESMARSRKTPDARRWRARFHHRILRVARRVEAAGDHDLPALRGAMAALEVGRAVIVAHGLRTRDDVPAGTRRRMDMVLRRLGTLSQRPDAAASSLARAAAVVRQPDAAILLDAAEALQANGAFFASPR